MKIRVLFPALALAASNALAADAPPEFPQTPEEVARLATDFTRNAEVLKDPKKFVPFVAVSTDPAFLFALSNQMMEPGRVAEMVNSTHEPGQLQRLDAARDRPRGLHALGGGEHGRQFLYCAGFAIE
jgi:hypothetical protein